MILSVIASFWKSVSCADAFSFCQLLSYYSYLTHFCLRILSYTDKYHKILDLGELWSHSPAHFFWDTGSVAKLGVEPRFLKLKSRILFAQTICLMVNPVSLMPKNIQHHILMTWTIKRLIVCAFLLNAMFCATILKRHYSSFVKMLQWLLLTGG